jgi:hypothetical protein
VRDSNSLVMISTALLTRSTTSYKGVSWWCVAGMLGVAGTPEHGTRRCWTSILRNFDFLVVRTNLHNRSHRRRQTVRTQFFEDDVASS